MTRKKSDATSMQYPRDRISGLSNGVDEDSDEADDDPEDSEDGDEEIGETMMSGFTEDVDEESEEVDEDSEDAVMVMSGFSEEVDDGTDEVAEDTACERGSPTTAFEAEDFASLRWACAQGSKADGRKIEMTPSSQAISAERNTTMGMRTLQPAQFVIMASTLIPLLPLLAEEIGCPQGGMNDVSARRSALAVAAAMSAFLPPPYTIAELLRMGQGRDNKQKKMHGQVPLPSTQREHKRGSTDTDT